MLKLDAQKILFCTSAVGYYESMTMRGLTSLVLPGRLGSSAQDWESEALDAEKKGVRVIITPLGFVMGNDGGALDLMALPFKWFVGGPLGRGR